MIHQIRSRTGNNDIGELFGFAPDDRSPEALKHKDARFCPFMGSTCSKTNHDKSEIYGVCSVSKGKNAGPSDVIICPKRLYAKNYLCLKDLANQVWGVNPARGFVVGGTRQDLRRGALCHDQSVVAFGQNSGNEVGVSGGASMSLDWVLQLYEKDSGGRLIAKEFICVEIQSIDITGNYRNAWLDYMGMTDPAKCYSPTKSGHGLNWANVHKRLIPQLIRKGNIAGHAPRCRGIFFILPDTVFKKFEEIMPNLKVQQSHQASGGLTVVTYVLGSEVYGQIRNLEKKRTVHYLVKDVAEEFIASCDPGTGLKLDRAVASLLS